MAGVNFNDVDNQAVTEQGPNALQNSSVNGVTLDSTGIGTQALFDDGTYKPLSASGVSSVTSSDPDINVDNTDPSNPVLSFANVSGFVTAATPVGTFPNDVNYVSAGANVSVFVNDVGYTIPGTNVSVFTNDAGYLATGANVSLLTNDANYVSSGDNVSVFVNDAAYTQPGTNISVFTNDSGYLATGANVSLLTNDANYVSSGANVSVFVNDAGYLATGANISLLTNDAGYITTITGSNHSQLTLDDGTNPHGTTATDVGLGNVDNTSDLDKPISNAQAAVNATFTSDIATNAGNISTNTTNIATNTGNIATNTGNIGTNTANIATNTSDITTIEITNPVDSLTAPATNRRWHKTDENRIYYFDGATWVSEQEMSLEFTENGATGSGVFLFHGNTRTSDIRGPVMPQDVKLERISIVKDSAINAGSIEVVAEALGSTGVLVDTATVPGSKGGVFNFNTQALLNASDFLAPRWVGTADANLFVTLFYRYRAS